jgi:hypothetical protein
LCNSIAPKTSRATGATTTKIPRQMNVPSTSSFRNAALRRPAVYHL